MEHNRVKVFEDKRFDYDGFGRLIRKRTSQHHSEQYFRYDRQHRLIQVAGVNGQPISQLFSYRYDALGRRIAKADTGRWVVQTTQINSVWKPKTRDMLSLM